MTLFQHDKNVQKSAFLCCFLAKKCLQQHTFQHTFFTPDQPPSRGNAGTLTRSNIPASGGTFP
jgi:hypothetical protein